MPKDYYAILGVAKSASTEEIRLAYRQKAKHIHPDVNEATDAQNSFQELNEAYITLSDPEKRSIYDNPASAQKEIDITDEELEEILRRRARQNQHFEFGYEPRNQYAPTDYKANEKGAWKINFAMLIISLTFIVDLMVFVDIGTATVTSTSQYIKNVERGKREFWTVIETDKGVFKKLSEQDLPKVGEKIEMKKSLFYGNLKYKNKTGKYELTGYGPIVTYLFSFIVFVAAALGISRFLNPEQRFNAAIISAFFCLILLGTLFLS